jgi:hypothetical protein
VARRLKLKMRENNAVADECQSNIRRTMVCEKAAQVAATDSQFDLFLLAYRGISCINVSSLVFGRMPNVSFRPSCSQRWCPRVVARG